MEGGFPNQNDDIHDPLGQQHQEDNPEDLLFVYKIQTCKKSYKHDWKGCPYKHYLEFNTRRDPSKYYYLPVRCPKWRTGDCAEGKKCNYAHGKYEQIFHPSIYRTQICKLGESCRIKFCPFAHNREELRIPSIPARANPSHQQQQLHHQYQGRRMEEIPPAFYDGGFSWNPHQHQQQHQHQHQRQGHRMEEIPPVLYDGGFFLNFVDWSYPQRREEHNMRMNSTPFQPAQNTRQFALKDQGISNQLRGPNVTATTTANWGYTGGQLGKKISRR